MIEIMTDVVLDTLIDGAKLLPFLFLTYLAMELLEHKTGEKVKFAVQRAGKFGPVVGSALGVVPQCGFSAAASSLYVGKIITMGTLIAIYLSTSDEMLPILISQKAPVALIAKAIICKVIIGMIAGIVTDLFVHKKILPTTVDIHNICEKDNCHCDESILKSVIKHTVQVFGFILLVSFILNCVFAFGGEEELKKILMDTPFVGLFLSGIVGLIPNCAASVAITELYMENALSFGAMICGLLVNAGVGPLILLKINPDKKNSFTVIGILFAVGIISGAVLNLIF